MVTTNRNKYDMVTTDEYKTMSGNVENIAVDYQSKGFGYRHQQCFILFLCLTTAYSMRACMGVALVGMIEDQEFQINVSNVTSEINNSDIKTEFKSSDSNESIIFFDSTDNDINDVSSMLRNVTTIKGDDLNDRNKIGDEFKANGFFNSILLAPPYPKFTWEKKKQDYILSSFQWGYMTLQIPAGQLAHRFGSRRLLSSALFINCVVSFALPWAAYWGGWVLIVIFRMIQGLSQACIIPAMHTFFGKWAPLEERARLAGFASGGQALGTVLGLPITGFLAASPLGWPGIFRFFGLLSGAVGLLLFFTVADSPADHPKISNAERRYIEEGLGVKEGQGKKHLPVPWCDILRSKGMWAIVVAHIGQTWGQLTLYTEVPAYMDKVMGVNIKANGVLTALPFMVMWFANFYHSWFTDMIIVKKILGVTNARKLANSIGCIIPAIGLVALAYVPKNIYVAEGILVTICAFKISSSVGFLVNHIDISPNFAGTMISISNFASNLVGSCAPIVAGIILTDVSDEILWRKVFLVAAGLYFFSNLFYVILGTAEKAIWNDPQEDEGLKMASQEEDKPIIPSAEKKS